MNNFSYDEPTNAELIELEEYCDNYSDYVDFEILTLTERL